MATQTKIDTTDYISIHGKNPRGRGGWTFCKPGDERNPAEWYESGIHAQYSVARWYARTHFKGEMVIRLLG